MRIGFFTDTYLPVSNGICYVIDIIRKDLEAAGHEVYIFAPQNFRTKLPKEKRVIRYKAIQGMLYSDQFTSFFWAPTEVDRIRSLKLDAIVIFTPSLIGALGAHAALKLDIPFVVQYGTDMEAYGEDYKFTTIFGLVCTMFIAPYFLKLGFKSTLKFYKDIFRRSNKNESYYRYVTRLMMELIHERATAVIATSEKTAAQLRKWPIKQDVVTIPTGVDALPAPPLIAKRFLKEHGVNESDDIILYAGRMSVEKNLDKLVEAFGLIAKKRPKAKLLMIGDFQYRQQLEERAAATRHGDSIIFTGLIDRSTLGSVYPLAKVFVFPSLTDCQALVLNEAALAGVPLVWCDTPKLNPVLQDGLTGLQAKDSAKNIASKIERLLSDEPLRRQMCRQAKKQARRYSEAKQSGQIEKLLEAICR